MHLDRFRHGLEIERAQMLDAMDKKRILLAHDLARDFEDGLGALIETAHEPGGVGVALGEIGLVLARASRRARPAPCSGC